MAKRAERAERKVGTQPVTSEFHSISPTFLVILSILVILANLLKKKVALKMQPL